MAALKRLLFGEAPWWFTFEVLGRAVVMYIALLAMLRVLGKRLSGQITILELGIMITLGAIVSAPMVMPDKGLVVGFVLLLCALGAQRGIGGLGVRSDRFELAFHGDTKTIVKDGVIDQRALTSSALSRDVVRALLRSKGIHHLGEVERLYLEASGGYTLWRARVPKPGLLVFSDDERPLLDRCRDVPERRACCVCGFVVDERDGASRCPTCGERKWSSAVELVESPS